MFFFYTGIGLMLVGNIAAIVRFVTSPDDQWYKMEGLDMLEVE